LEIDFYFLSKKAEITKPKDKKKEKKLP